MAWEMTRNKIKETSAWPYLTSIMIGTIITLVVKVYTNRREEKYQPSGTASRIILDTQNIADWTQTAATTGSKHNSAIRNDKTCTVGNNLERVTHL